MVVLYSEFLLEGLNCVMVGYFVQIVSHPADK